MATFTEIIKNNPALKSLVHRMIIPKNEAKPRLWIRWLVNPFFHKRGTGSKVSRRCRLDALPFNKFELGEHSVIEDFSVINNGVGDIIIGKNSLIGISNIIIGPVIIGNDIIIAQNVVISGLNHKYEQIDRPILAQSVTTKQITIEDECWIGANSVITAGVTIGKHSVIAAGSIVTKDIPPYSVAAGNPAKIIKQYNQESNSWVKINNGN